MSTQTGEEERHDAPELLHSIGETARLLGVSTGMLRLWERERLIQPRRTPGGHRLYSSDDLQRLRHINRLRRIDRLNSAAIRQVIGPPDQIEHVTSPAPDLELGRRLRALRTKRKLSLAALAEIVGLSVSFLSAVELGQSSISVGNLFKLAEALGTTVPGLGSDDRTQDRRVVHPAERPRYIAGQGRVVIEDLIATPGAIEAQRIELAPNGGSEESYAHSGEEFIHVLSGQVTFWIDERDRYDLREGDSLNFRSTQLHRWQNTAAIPAVVLWINVQVVEGVTAGTTQRKVARHRGPDNATSL